MAASLISSLFQFPKLGFFPDKTLALLDNSPTCQTVLLLHKLHQPYKVTEDYPVPKLLRDDEVLIRTRAIGLNPIDWKGP